MTNLPAKHILSNKPKEYLQQGTSHCGVYSIKAILSAYGLDNKSHPKFYHPNWFGQITGLTLGKNYYVKILKSYGIGAERKSAENLSDSEKIILLKTLLARNTPVMIRIGNGYYHSDEYKPILGKVVAHWITLWGYDDEKQLFYAYDSGMLKQHQDKTTPIGNTIRTYKEILRDWNFGRWQPWTWPLSGMENCLYIKVNIKVK
ncbi:hypothetical protein HYU15_02785 [Candidatus Woesearchaeota archaeon]|nr:hypothetical protein [Candidatus Woesearchaeota archaeon]